MGRRRKKGFNAGLILAVIIICLVLSAVLVGYMVLSGNGVNSNPVTQTVNREITKKAVDTVIQKETGTDITYEEIKEQMSEEDAEELESVINKYADQGLISEALEIYGENGGDIRSTAEALKDKLNAEDMARLYELYKKYGSQVLQE